MKIGRTVLAFIGLVAIGLTYATGNLYFLSLAIIVFFIGLVVMGAIRRPTRSKEENNDENNKEGETEKKKKRPRTGEPY